MLTIPPLNNSTTTTHILKMTSCCTIPSTSKLKMTSATLLLYSCWYMKKKLEDQQMSVLPPHLATPCPVFTYVAVDLTGPFVCKREGPAKTTRRNSGTKKTWAALFVCLQTKAVKIYLVGGLATEDFLLAWYSFTADHSQPSVCYSDRGTNLIAAVNEGGDTTTLQDYDWEDMPRQPGTFILQEANSGMGLWRCL